MTSPWGKFLITGIVTGPGYTWAWWEGGMAMSASIPPGTYDSMLELLTELADRISDEINPLLATVDVSEVGIVSLNIPGMTDMRWDVTSDALSELLGFDETEPVIANSITGTNQHQYGWYPGAITYRHNPNRGAGIVFGTRWVPQDSTVRTVSGSGKQRAIAPGRLRRLRRLRFDLLSLAEVRDHDIGVDALLERYLTRLIRWYPDRSLGTPDDPGETANPWDAYDEDVAYWLVTLASQPTATERAENPDFFSVDIELNGEPKPA